MVRPSIELDCTRLAPRLRTADRAEIVASSGEKSVDVLRRGLEASRPCMTVTLNGRPVAMFGVVPDPEGGSVSSGRVWMLASDRLLLVKTLFLRESHKWVDRVGAYYDILWNVVDARNTTHIEWIKWVGFTFVHEHKNFGALGLPFLEFVRIEPRHV